LPMRRSLTNRERLKKRVDLTRIFESPNKVQCSGLALLYLENGLPWSRFAVTTKKRGYRGSAQRNREKRIGREIYRNHKEKLKSGFDIVLIFKPGDFTFRDRERQFQSLIKRAGINL
jgi:ribonuclease P protein component